MAKPLEEQLANIGAEIGRAILWQKSDVKASSEEFYLGMELLDLTIEDPKNRTGTQKELYNLKEALGDYFLGENLYHSTSDSWDNYFNFFSVIATAKYF